VTDQRPTIEDLRTLRRNLPSKWWYGSEILGILLDDLIERRESTERQAADVHARYGDLLEADDGEDIPPLVLPRSGPAGESYYVHVEPVTATARDLLADPTGDET